MERDVIESIFIVVFAQSDLTETQERIILILRVVLSL